MLIKFPILWLDILKGIMKNMLVENIVIYREYQSSVIFFNKNMRQPLVVLSTKPISMLILFVISD